MDIISYCIFATIYIIIFNLALSGKQEMAFDFFLIIGTFGIGLGIGYFFNSYDIGFIIAIVLSFIFV